MITPPSRYPRDVVGYGCNPPPARWPGGPRIALQFVLNCEEGGENSVLRGDAGCEHRGVPLTVRLRAADTKALRRMVRPVRA